jgi:hypothetical protein
MLFWFFQLINHVKNSSNGNGKTCHEQYAIAGCPLLQNGTEFPTKGSPDDVF